MPYSWQTPVTDRTAASYYNYTDVERVNNNTQYLQEYIDTNMGISVVLSTYTTQTISSLPTVTLMNLLEHNINLLKNAVGTPLTWQTLGESWTTSSVFDYSDANNLESNLLNLKTMVEGIVAEYAYCGAFICGEDFDLAG